MTVSRDLDLFVVVFRRSTVVEERTVHAADIVKAAKKAERMTAEDGDFPGWSVYRITRQ